jgi:hypothetical protein
VPRRGHIRARAILLLQRRNTHTVSG